MEPKRSATALPGETLSNFWKNEKAISERSRQTGCIRDVKLTRLRKQVKTIEIDRSVKVNHHVSWRSRQKAVKFKKNYHLYYSFHQSPTLFDWNKPLIHHVCQIIWLYTLISLSLLSWIKGLFWPNTKLLIVWTVGRRANVSNVCVYDIVWLFLVNQKDFTLQRKGLFLILSLMLSDTYNNLSLSVVKRSAFSIYQSFIHQKKLNMGPATCFFCEKRAVFILFYVLNNKNCITACCCAEWKL